MQASKGVSRQDFGWEDNTIVEVNKADGQIHDHDINDCKDC